MKFPPKAALSKLVNSLKGASPRRLRQEFRNSSSTAGGRNDFSRQAPASPDRPAVLRRR
ncbi:transposase [Streptomyces sp. NPDC002742]|uniref:transposase n=1 Tax=Streptomyces sp. NPDC002742 TaxID=3364663 RepID=UPI0036AF398D